MKWLDLIKKRVKNNVSCTSITKRTNFHSQGWGEFYYIVQRRVGRPKAEETLALLEQLPITILSVDDHLVREAAEIKAEYPVSYADAFCIATSQRSKADILTNDPKFKSVQYLVTVRWIAE